MSTLATAVKQAQQGFDIGRIRQQGRGIDAGPRKQGAQALLAGMFCGGISLPNLRT
jgi:hypothetical protein